MTRYAKDTSVSVGRSKGEIEDTVTRYGAEEFASGWKGNEAMVEFRVRDLRVRFVLTMPELSEFQSTPGGRRTRGPDGQQKAWEQGCRSHWRSLALVIKAKLEAVESGITTFEEEFLSYLVRQNGRTIGSELIPQLPKVVSGGKLPRLAVLADPDAAVG